uniref:MucR family transcriptional regulator n=1 Tax=Methylobacterium sp. NMS12 TaxID=3079766 RepID=UPI003F88101E
MEETDRILDEDHGQKGGEHDLVALTADIVSAYVSNNRVPPAEMPTLLSSVHAAMTALGGAPAAADGGPEKPTPAQIRKSIKPDGLISFIDGKPYKTLKRHLTGNGLTMDEYRERYGLPRDYPSTAASYSEQRSALAKSLGLGQQRRKAAPKEAEVAEAISEAPTPRGRKKVDEAAAEPVEKPARARKPKAPAAE